MTETIPGDSATGVPLTTGIEITFNQTGVSAVSLKQHFSIKPAVAGRFQVAGRTLVFVPSKPLAKGRVYTVTVTHGLPLAGTGQVLAQDVVVRFETAAKAKSPVTVSLRRTFLEANPREKAAIGVQVDVPDGAKAPTSIPVTVHRLAGMTAAMDAWQAIETAPEWTLVSTAPPVPLAGLTRVVKASVRVQTVDQSYSWIQLPKRLSSGWYLVTETWAGVPRQAVLQVTDIATFSMLATGKSAVWVNDLATRKAVAGATVTIDGKRLGTTDGRGLLVAATPSSLAAGNEPSSAPIVVVRYGSRSAFQPVSSGRYCAACASTTGADGWWQLFAGDRYQYRSTDTINAWGVVRNRDTGKVPSSVTVTLRPGEGSTEIDTAISTTSVSPDANGAFSVRVALKDLPVGAYRLMLSTGKTQLGELWVQVATIVKPAYRIEMSTDRHAVLNGASVTASVDATFFEGTPVAGTELSLSPGSAGGETKVSTDADGHASGPVAVRLDSDGDQWGVTTVGASPTLPEEAEISTSSDVAVFRATALVDTTAAVAGTQVTITGKVSDVAFERFETVSPARLWEVDPRGAGRPNAAVQVQVVQHTPVRHQTGTRYDFITKQVVPLYEYTDQADTVSSQTVRTGADGTFRLVVTVKGGNRSYEVLATYTDEGNRQVTASTVAAGQEVLSDSRNAWLEAADPGHESGQYSVGEAVRVAFKGGLENAPVSRYLYAVTQRGLTYATVGTSPTFRTTFTSASVPSIGITAVRFNGYGYDLAVTGWRAALRLADRTLAVQVTPDKARYAPGDTASVTVRTLGPGGRPVAASVYLQVVDEKLYAMGAAEQVDPLGELYGNLDDGIIAWAASHRTPADDQGGKGEGGDTTGGGGGGDVRSNFRDWLVATMVTTGSDGTARVTVPLSDDLTSWHVSAAAVDRALEAGSGTGLLAVGLPFFAEATIAPEYLVADRPIIRVRGFGSGLATGEKVTFTVTSDTLPMSGVTVTADAFKAAEVSLPALSEGTHRIRIAATVGSGSSLRSDTLVRTFEVVTTRTSRLMTTWAALDGPVAVKGGEGLTRVTLVDAGRGRVVPLLQELAWTGSGRADRVLAAGLANRVLVEQFGLEAPAMTGETELDRFRGENGALAIVPYGSNTNLDVTALAAIAGDPRLDAARLSAWLHAVMDGGDQYTREQRLLALAGLAGLGEPVLADVREAAAQTNLTVPEQVNVAIAAFYAGDEALARSIERDVLAAHGLRLGPWARIDPGPGADAAVQTARLAVVAASLGDPVAADMDAWVAANPPTTTTVDLERALAARGWAQRVAGASAIAAVTVDGTRREVTIRPGEPASVVLTPAQAATARLEPVSGSVLAVTSWDGALDPASLTPAKGQQLARTVTPAGAIGPTDTVIVTLTVTLGPDARDECWRVTDLAPSGLAPISGGGSWQQDEFGNAIWSGTSPDFVDGQRVEFCVTRNPKQPVQTLRYVARVVTPGTYLWEPAVLQSEVVPDQGVVLPPATVTIKGSGT
ncbi:MAG TPA: Ig-like domain-containing protein [Candidatus Limnocylindrales bacterium]